MAMTCIEMTRSVNSLYSDCLRATGRIESLRRMDVLVLLDWRSTWTSVYVRLNQSSCNSMVVPHMGRRT